MNSTEEPENLKQFSLGLLSGKMKIKTPTWYWILLAVAFVLLSIVINWWVAFASICVLHVLLMWLGFMAYRDNKKGTDTVREITGLETERCKLIRTAARTGDWSKIATEELRTPSPPDRTLVLQKRSKARLKIRIITAIIIERNKRKADEMYSNMMGQVVKDVVKNTDPKTLEEMRKQGLI